MPCFLPHWCTFCKSERSSPERQQVEQIITGLLPFDGQLFLTCNLKPWTLKNLFHYMPDPTGQGSRGVGVTGCAQGFKHLHPILGCAPSTLSARTSMYTPLEAHSPCSAHSLHFSCMHSVAAVHACRCNRTCCPSLQWQRALPPPQRHFQGLAITFFNNHPANTSLAYVCLCITTKGRRHAEKAWTHCQSASYKKD